MNTDRKSYDSILSPTLREYLHMIKPTDREAARRCRARWDGLAKPLRGLGQLEEAVCRLAAISGSDQVALDDRAVLVFCADNGCVAQGVTQCGPEVTAAVAREIAAGKGNVSAMARAVNSNVFVYDVGLLQDEPGLRPCKQGRGTADISQGPAMSREQAEQTVLFGMEQVKRLRELGYDILVGGEMGIGNTTTSAATAACLLGLDEAELVGRGAGLSDAGLARKRQVVAQALRVNAPHRDDPLDVLAKLGGYDIAALTGLFLGGACWQTPVVIDGVIAAVAALLAVKLAPCCREYLLASHVSREPAAGLLLSELGLSPVIAAGLALGEGTGGLLLLPLLDAALAVYEQSSTFACFGLEAYTPQEDQV